MPNWELWGRWIRWILACLVFFILPFLLVGYGLGTIWETRESNSISEAYDRLDAIALAVRRRENPEEYLAKQLTALYLHCQRLGDIVSVRRDLEKGIRALKKRFPNMLRFTITNDRGELVSELCDGTPPKDFLIKKLHGIMVRKFTGDNGVDQTAKSLFPMFKSFLGQVSTPEILLRLDQDLVSVGLGDEDRYFYRAISRWGGLFVHVSRTIDWDLIAVRDLCRRIQILRPQPGIELGCHDISGSFDGYPGDLAQALGDFHRSTNPHIHAGNRLFSIMAFSNTGRLWIARSRKDALNLDGQRLAFTLIGSLLFGVFAIVSFRVMVRGDTFAISMRRQLVALFGFAGGLPLAVVIFTGWDYLDAKWNTRMRQSHDENIRALQAFDTRFPQTRGTLEVQLQRFMKNRRYDTPQHQKRLHEQLAAIKKRFNPGDVTIFNFDGKVTWDEVIWRKELGPESKASQNKKIMGQLIRNIMSTLNEKYKTEEDKRNDEKQSGGMASFLLESLGGMDNPAQTLARNLMRIFDFNIAGNNNWTYFHPIRRPNGFAEIMVGIVWNRNNLDEYYLRNYLLRAQRDLPDTRLFALNPKRNSQFPKEFPLAKKLWKFQRELLLRQNVTIGTLRIGGRSYLLSGIKTKEMSENFLIAIRDDWRIRREIDTLRHRLWAFSALSGFISLFLGVLLSQRFLKPIGDLSAGVQAIQERKFDHRVPPGEADELGDLARTFNRVMEGLSELEVGRIVQESLFPIGGISVDEYRIYGTTCSASELGGDYFDLQKLKDGRVLILIGDVSGHGVPAALVMSMAKAIVERECEDSPTPASVLEAVHRIMLKTLKRKRMMTCFLAILDPKTHELHIANAGHNYPYLFAPGKPPTPISKSSMPLGSKKILNLVPETLTLAPGETVLCYTDGLIEAQQGGQPLGYDRVMAAVDERLEGDPETVCRNIFSWHRSLTGEGPQEDDITLVLLRRLGPGDAADSPGGSPVGRP